MNNEEENIIVVFSNLFNVIHAFTNVETELILIIRYYQNRIKNILTKSLGSNNPTVLLKATLNGLKKLRTYSQIIEERYNNNKSSIIN